MDGQATVRGGLYGTAVVTSLTTVVLGEFAVKSNAWEVPVMV
jgi:hypothetical protein